MVKVTMRSVDKIEFALNFCDLMWKWGEANTTAPWILAADAANEQLFSMLWTRRYTLPYPREHLINLHGPNASDRLRGRTFDTPVLLLGYDEMNHEKLEQIEKVIAACINPETLPTYIRIR